MEAFAHTADIKVDHRRWYYTWILAGMETLEVHTPAYVASQQAKRAPILDSWYVFTIEADLTQNTKSRQLLVHYTTCRLVVTKC